MSRASPIVLKPLGQQVLIITGATSGIGLTTVREAAARGAAVLLVARDEAILRETVDAIRETGGRAEYVVADVGNLDDVRRAAAAAIDHFGRIDTWVNNAGVAIYAKLVDTPIAEHQRLFQTNYFGAVHGALTALEHMRRAGGAIITVASIAADIPSPIMGAYAASKHAIKGFIHSLRIEIVADRLPVAITLIKPSGIDTPIAQHAANHVEGEAMIPVPVYDPSVVAAAILDAAEHPRRDVTVGGGGKLQTLLVEHFPQALDLFGRWFETMLVNGDKPRTIADNLEEPVANGLERSPEQGGRYFSLFTTAARHPLPVFVGLAALSTVFMAGAARRARRTERSHKPR
jgi:short-subunit dehydrogenase